MFFFLKNRNANFKPRSVEHAYLALLDDDILSAQAIFESIDSPRAKWGCVLIQILQGFVQNTPTYFQIRNYYR